MGFSLEDAAAAQGIDLTEALKWASERLNQKGALSAELKLMAESSLQIALRKLKEIAQAQPRLGEVDPETGNVLAPINTDLDAAKFLAKFSLDALKLTGAAAAPAQKDPAARIDLFDLKGLWNLKNPNAS